MTSKRWLPVTVTHRGEGVSPLAVITANGPTALPQTPEAGLWPSAETMAEPAVAPAGGWLVTGVREVTAFLEIGGFAPGEGVVDVVLHATRDPSSVSPARTWRRVRAGDAQRGSGDWW